MTYSQAIKNYPDLREELEERAGIIEFMGGKARAEAEALAVTLIIGRERVKEMEFKRCYN